MMSLTEKKEVRSRKNREFSKNSGVIQVLSGVYLGVSFEARLPFGMAFKGKQKDTEASVESEGSDSFDTHTHTHPLHHI